MTDNEIIKALEKFKCVNCNGDCAKESYDDLDCPLNLAKFSLALINRLKANEEKNENIIRFADKTIEKQKAEIDILIRKKESLRDEIAEQQAEIERLKEIEYMYNDLCR